MDIKQLKNKDLTATVPLGDGVELEMRYISPEEMAHLRKQATKILQQGYRATEEVDDQKFQRLLADAAVIGWTGLEDDGEPFPCTGENRAFLMAKWSDFRLAVLDAAPDYQKMLKFAEKNSSTTSGQSSISPA